MTRQWIKKYTKALVLSSAWMCLDRSVCNRVRTSSWPALSQHHVCILNILQEDLVVADLPSRGRRCYPSPRRTQLTLYKNHEPALLVPYFPPTTEQSSITKSTPRVSLTMHFPQLFLALGAVSLAQAATNVVFYAAYSGQNPDDGTTGCIGANLGTVKQSGSGE